MNDEGVIKFDCNFTRGPPPQVALIGELKTTRQRLFDRGLIGHDPDADVDFGNISIRGPEPGQLIITGTQTGHLPELRPEHFVLITHWNLLSNSVSCVGAMNASSETLTHAAIYALSEEINAVIHVHDQANWDRLHGSIPTTAAGIAYGTPAMAEAFNNLYNESNLADRKVAAMGGHPGGLISFGAGLAEAEQRLLQAIGAAK